MPVFYEIATLDQITDLGERYALTRIDTDKHIDGGCEAMIVSMHRELGEAKQFQVLAQEEGKGNG